MRTEEEYMEVLEGLVSEYGYSSVEELVGMVVSVRSVFDAEDGEPLKKYIDNESVRRNAVSIRKLADNASFEISPRHAVLSAIKADEDALAYIEHKKAKESKAIPSDEFDLDVFGGETISEEAFMMGEEPSEETEIPKKTKEKKKAESTPEEVYSDDALEDEDEQEDNSGSRSQKRKKTKAEKIILGSIAFISVSIVLYAGFYVYGIYKEMTAPKLQVPLAANAEEQTQRDSGVSKEESRFAANSGKTASGSMDDSGVATNSKNASHPGKSRFAVDTSQAAKMSHTGEAEKKSSNISERNISKSNIKASTPVQDESEEVASATKDAPLHQEQIGDKGRKESAYPPIPEEAIDKAAQKDKGGVCNIMPKYYSESDTYIYYVKRGDKYIPAFQDRDWDGKGIKISKRIIGLSVDSKNGLVEVKEGKFLPMELFSSCTVVEN